MQLNMERISRNTEKYPPRKLVPEQMAVMRDPHADTYEFSFGWTVSVEWVSRGIAEQILAEQNSINRKYLRKKHIEQLKREMDAGQFYMTPEGLIFDSNGNLVDGQHRLYALLASTLDGLMMIVWRKVEPKLFEKLNAGVQRSFGDRNRTTREVQDVANQIARIIYGQGHSHTQNLKVLEAFRETIERFYSAQFTHRRGVTQQPIRTSVVLRMAQNPKQEEWLMTQFKALATLDYNSMENSIQSLCRQVTVDGISGWDLQVRSWRAFDFTRRNNTRIQVRDSTEDYQQMRAVIKSKLGD